MLTKPIDESYDSFYRRGGWTYDRQAEAEFLLRQIVRPLKIHSGASILDLGCGTGLHAWLFERMGMRVTGVDSCPAAIDRAREFLGVKFQCVDASSFLRHCGRTFNVVFARGMSWFHYELEGETNQKGVYVDNVMRSIMGVLKPGGLFVLQIRTDFTGSYDFTGVRNHTWRQSTDFLCRYGDIRLLRDWRGIPLENGCAACRSGGNLLAAVQRPPGRQTKRVFK
jgi:SAM-dependent methyltransferase